MLNRPKPSSVLNPTVNVRPCTSPRAAGFGRKPRTAAAPWTHFQVSARSCPRPFSALDAVPIETRARRATSDSVGLADLAPSRGFGTDGASSATGAPPLDQGHRKLSESLPRLVSGHKRGRGLVAPPKSS